MKKLRRLFKATGKVLFICILTVSGIVFLVRLINVYKYKISSSVGIQESTTVRINDADLHVQIRGENTANPLIIFIHGGPGFPLTYLSAYHQSYLESKYTFLNYDQRNSGRTFFRNESNANALTIDAMLDDLHQIIEFGKERMNQDQVIIMGQSWGSVLGAMYSQKYPENVSAYIGVGQVVDFDQGKLFAANEALGIAKSEGSTSDMDLLIKTMERFEKSKDIDSVDLENLNSMIIKTSQYLRGEGEMSPLKQIYTGVTSPYMSIDDMKWFLKASNTQEIVALQKPLINFMYYDFDIRKLNKEYEVPVFFIQGECDYITPTKMVEDYFTTIEAPAKELVTIKSTGHTPFLDNPEAFARQVDQLLVKK